VCGSGLPLVLTGISTVLPPLDHSIDSSLRLRGERALAAHVIAHPDHLVHRQGEAARLVGLDVGAVLVERAAEHRPSDRRGRQRERHGQPPNPLRHSTHRGTPSLCGLVRRKGDPAEGESRVRWGDRQDDLMVS